MPKIWDDTIEEHRRSVREATLNATAELVAGQGLAAVTMSQIAKETGIGRATLYKYFSNVEAILVAWHERQITRHLEQLAEVRDRSQDAGARVAGVLEAFAFISHEHHGSDSAHGHQGDGLAESLHQGPHAIRARHKLHAFVRELIIEAAAAGAVRDDIPAGELASYCINSLAAANNLPSDAAVDRLVALTLDGLSRRA